MGATTNAVDQYLASLPEDKLVVIEQLRKVIKKNLPKGFKEAISYGMLGYVVPHSIYPAGYHCKPEEALPFLSVAAQKNGISLYHMGVYADTNLYNWFVDAYAQANVGKLDMGKSCIRFKKLDKIPYELIGELCKKVTVDQWIAQYEQMKNK